MPPWSGAPGAIAPIAPPTLNLALVVRKQTFVHAAPHSTI